MLTSASSALPPSMNRLFPASIEPGVTPMARERESRAGAGRSGLVKYQRPQFDTFARRGVRWRRRVDEGGVRPKPGAAVGCGIVALQQQRLIRRHFGDIVPTMVGVVLDRISFAA